jgi:hypothetical protein
MAKVSTRADMALIQGAAKIGQSMMPADLSGLDKVMEAGVGLATKALDEKRKIEQEKVDAYDAFTQAAEEVSLSSSALGNVLYEDTVSFANQQKEAYLAALKNGDQAGMMAAKRAMTDRSAFTQQHKAFIGDLADMQQKGELSSAHTKEEMDYMKAVLKGEYTVEKNDKGEMVFNVNGVKKTNAEFEDMYILKNFELGAEIGKLNQDAKKDIIFDRNNVKNKIAQSLPSTVKEFRAAIHDDLGGGASFKQLLENDKTLDQELLMAIGGYDPNGDGKVDPDEKANFINAVTDHNDPNFNLEVSKKILAEKMTNVVENGHASHWAKQAEGAAAKTAAEMRMKMFENQLRIDLDNAKTDNDRKLAYDKYQQELGKISYKDQLDITKEKRELGASQEEARNQWNNITFDEGDKPVSKAQTYVNKFRSILGDDVTDIRYGTDFEDEQGNTIPKGYYAVIQTTDNKGKSIEVNQLLTQGEDLKFDDVARYIDPKKQLIPSKQTDSFSDNQVLSWLANNTGDPNYQTILDIYNSKKTN